MNRIRRSLTALALVVVLCAGCGQAKDQGQKIEEASLLDPEHPITISIWHYYNGAQQEAFNSLVDEFNNTLGKESGIIAEAFGYGSVTELADSVKAAVNGKVGADEVPNIFSAYTDTAYEVNQKGTIVDLSSYLTTEEQEQYMDSYMEEGHFSEDNSLKIMPIAKSTELLMINKTDWDAFAKAVPAKLSDLETLEGVAEVSRKYYEWTDMLTPEPNDGKAFYGRDSMANYMIIGSRQLGKEIFTVDAGMVSLDFDRAVIKQLWDYYYIPFIKGYFTANGRFRSDDIKTGSVIAFTGSSSGAAYFPKEVVTGDTESYSIDMEVMEAPQFADGESYAVQQGAGMMVAADKEEKVYASVQFLKWFTGTERNIEFAVNSGYLPVKKEANNIKMIRENSTGDETNLMKSMDAAIKTVNDNQLYTMQSFAHADSARNVLEYALSDQAEHDREIVKANLLAGMSLEQAAAEFVTEQNFERWYQDTKTKLEEAVKPANEVK